MEVVLYEAPELEVLSGEKDLSRSSNIRAIVGTYADEQMFRDLRATLHRLNINVIKPRVIPRKATT
ncbi:MAG: hypothetical protein JW955_00770 [Sedimentisphaerales bacterium]|nr:hypothetical protein [Sedimentisphaerales bacterium]